MKKKLKPLEIAEIGFCFISSVGVDTVLTGLASTVLPKTYGFPGLIQKICVKAGTVGLSLVAADAIDNVVGKYAKLIVEDIERELENNPA